MGLEGRVMAAPALGYSVHNLIQSKERAYRGDDSLAW